MNHAFEIALFAHLLGVAVWIGGMVFAHFCLRTSLAELTPQSRLPLMESVLGKFFNWVAGSVLVILLSGGYMMAKFGNMQAPWPIQAMAGIGIVMMLLFGHLRFALFPRVRRAVQAQRWPDGARAMTSIRRLVVVNLVLGIATIYLAVIGAV
ncbi:MAG: CopD family protein [Pararobbsia sp.]